MPPVEASESGAAAAGTPGTAPRVVSPATALAASAGRSATTTITTTTTTNDESTPQSQPEVLHLTLRASSNVRWDESVVDNEGLGRKSSKRCCIFHKQRKFGESSTDSSDEEGGDGDAKRKIAHPKKKVPNHLRFHA
jgi:protein phosphatase 1 regulatory subunit 11